jgi:uncharacterized membrane protein YoaK (UPF0700 family)
VLFGNESISAYTRANVTIWMVLAFQAGILNIGGFMACQHFVSHVTGYATLMGFEIGRGSYAQAFGVAVVPIFFLVGAMMSGILVDLRVKLRKKPQYYVVFGVLFLLILTVVVLGFNNYFGKFGRPEQSFREYVLLALLCLICGMQNGTITLVSRSVVRTTHLTGVTTDLGIGLVRVMNRRRLEGVIENEDRANLMRIGIILHFTMGSVIGMMIFRHWGYRGFLFPTAISGGLFFTTFYYQVIRPMALNGFR